MSAESLRVARNPERADDGLVARPVLDAEVSPPPAVAEEVQPSPARQGIRERLKFFYLTIDLRSLALFRILIGSLLVMDWVYRWPYLEAFYTSFGVLPLDSNYLRFTGPYHFSLLTWANTLTGVQLLFGAGLICYVLFLVGYRTKIFGLLSLLFFHSVLSRNTLILNGGDEVLLTMLIWGMFLPLGRRFSLDAVRKPAREDADANAAPDGTPSPPARAWRAKPSVAAFAIIFQIAIIYFLTALVKSGDSWLDGSALYYTMHLDQIALPTGHWLSQQPMWLIKMLTWSTLVIEFLALPLILLPWCQPLLRRTAVLCLTAMHLGIWMTINIGTFPLVMISLNALLLDSAFWDSLRRQVSHRFLRLAALPEAARGLVVRGHSAVLNPFRLARSRFLKSPKTIASAEGEGVRVVKLPAAAGRRRRPVLAILANGLAALLFLGLMMDSYNLNVSARFKSARVYEPVALRAFLQLAELRPDWHLFAPNPLRIDGWFVIDGVTASGEHVDPLTGQAPGWQKPADLASNNNRFWRKYLYHLLRKKSQLFKDYFVGYIMRKDEREHPSEQRLVKFNLGFVLEKTLPPGAPQPFPLKRILIHHYDDSIEDSDIDRALTMEDTPQEGAP
ncbi:MAG TPA: HTTM domain-containing protein [Pyrinomonadaceae bacterium]